MNQSEDFGKILKLWPNLVDHYSLLSGVPSSFVLLVSRTIILQVSVAQLSV